MCYPYNSWQVSAKPRLTLWTVILHDCCLFILLLFYYIGAITLLRWFIPIHWLPIHCYQFLGCPSIAINSLAVLSLPLIQWLNIHSHQFISCPSIAINSLVVHPLQAIHWLSIHFYKFIVCPSIAIISLDVHPFL